MHNNEPEERASLVQGTTYARAPYKAGSARVRIVISSTVGREYQGHLVHVHSGATCSFQGVVQMLEVIDTLIEDMALQATHRKRRWSGVHAEVERKVPVAQEHVEQDVEVATFLVQVKYRQNSSWQGSIQWLESGSEMSFRSTLELLQLMESAVGAAPPPAWEKPK